YYRILYSRTTSCSSSIHDFSRGVDETKSSRVCVQHTVPDRMHYSHRAVAKIMLEGFQHCPASTSAQQATGTVRTRRTVRVLSYPPLVSYEHALSQQFGRGFQVGNSSKAFRGLFCRVQRVTKTALTGIPCNKIVATQ
ncbi:unnamed protein product, partial [Sphacelaria rigidula]